MFKSVLNFSKTFATKWLPFLGETSGSSIASQLPSIGNEIKSNPYKTNSANQNRQEIGGSIWAGMTAQQLVQSLGEALTKQYSGKREIWTYLHLKGQGTKTAIALENGIVINWQDMPVNAYTPTRPSSR